VHIGFSRFSAVVLIALCAVGGKMGMAHDVFCMGLAMVGVLVFLLPQLDIYVLDYMFGDNEDK